MHLGQVAVGPVATPILEVVKMAADGNCLLHALAYESRSESPSALAAADHRLPEHTCRTSGAIRGDLAGRSRVLAERP